MQFFQACGHHMSCPDRNKYVCFSLELWVETQRYAFYSVVIDAKQPLPLFAHSNYYCAFLITSDYLFILIDWNMLLWFVFAGALLEKKSFRVVAKCERLFMLMYTCTVYVCRCHDWPPFQPYHVQCIFHIVYTRTRTFTAQNDWENPHRLAWGSNACKLLANQALSSKSPVWYAGSIQAQSKLVQKLCHQLRLVAASSIRKRSQEAGVYAGKMVFMTAVRIKI